MAEILLFAIIFCVLFSPMLIAGFMAKSMGRNFWFWFGISFLLPVISIIILVFLKDNEPEKGGHKLADHVREREGIVNRE